MSNIKIKDLPQSALDTLFNTPEWYLMEFSGDYAHFVQMNRDTYNQSIFTDKRRIITVNKNIYRIKVITLLALFESKNYPMPPVKFIFHVAHCGSTLFSRALDNSKHNLVYREPNALRQLAVHYADSKETPTNDSMLMRGIRLVYFLLSRRYDESQSVIIKANVPVNFILLELLKLNSNTSSIILYSNLESFLTSALKSEKRKRWIDVVSRELENSISLINGIQPSVLQSLSPTKTAIYLWLAQSRMFHSALNTNKHIRTLNSEVFFNHPKKILSAAFEFFDHTVPPEDIQNIIDSNLFTSHAKNPTLAYNNQTRMDEMSKYKQLLTEDITEGLIWANNKIPDLSDLTTMPASLIS